MLTHDVQDNGSSSSPDGEPGEVMSKPIGRVASPVRQEATSARYFFWVPRDVIVEKTQLIRTNSNVAEQEIVFYGVVEEVYRRSRRRSMDEEVDAFDGDLSYTPPFSLEGVTFADVMLLRAEPPLLTPPLEESLVYLCAAEEAAIAYDFVSMLDHETHEDWRLPIGLLRNGGLGSTAGAAYLDVRDLYGERAGHLNVTGQAGRGTKSSFLLAIVRVTLDFARKRDDGNAAHSPFTFRPIVFNVKGNDLMFIDLQNKGLTDDRRKIWAQMGISEPSPFVNAQFFSPCEVTHGPINRGLPRILRPVPEARQTRTYYWTLEDVVGFGLWPYLFSESSQQSESLMAMADHVLDCIAEPCDPDEVHPAGLKLRVEASHAAGTPHSFEELGDWLRGALRDQTHPARDHGIHAFGTCRALLSRLGLVLGQEGTAIFDRGIGHGQPLRVLVSGTSDPVVIDIATLPVELRRFVVAAVLDQVKERQVSPQRIPGQVYALVLDELGIYAPRGARDPITRLFEHVAAQLRSQGIILLGAQQEASKVSETIFGNAEVKALGVTSPVEIQVPTWSHLLTPAQKSRALMLQADEKMVLTGRGWMNVIVPFPAWAMKESEAVKLSPIGGNGHGPGVTNAPAQFPLNRPEH